MTDAELALETLRRLRQAGVPPLDDDTAKAALDIIADLVKRVRSGNT